MTTAHIESGLPLLAWIPGWPGPFDDPPKSKDSVTQDDDEAEQTKNTPNDSKEKTVIDPDGTGAV